MRDRALSEKFIEIIPDKLYWVAEKGPPKIKTPHINICVDDALAYEPLALDFGPLDLGKIHFFCIQLEKVLANEQYRTHSVYHHTSLDPAK